MARTIEQIKNSIIANLSIELKLSTSAVAEWRIWVHCIASALYSFEVILDLFKKEMEVKVGTQVPGSLIWYNDLCYFFQYGHSLSFDKDTAKLYYPQVDAASRIIKIASVAVNNGTLIFKVATKNEKDEVVPLSDIQLLNFKNYLDATKFAGTKTNVISTTADTVKYSVNIYYDPSVTTLQLEKDILATLEVFKTSQRFGGVIYKHEFINTITQVPGVTTVKVLQLQRKGVLDISYIDIDIRAELHAGYYNFDKDSTIQLININEL